MKDNLLIQNIKRIGFVKSDNPNTFIRKLSNSDIIKVKDLDLYYYNKDGNTEIKLKTNVNTVFIIELIKLFDGGID